MVSQIQEKAFKVLIVGDGGIGKSTFIQRLVRDIYAEQKITLGLNHELYSVQINSTKINFMIWDLGGQKQFSELHPYYTKGVKAILYCFDTSRYQTFDNIHKWIQLIEKQDEQPSSRILLGLKNDAGVKGRKISEFEITQLCDTFHLERYFQCSSKNKINIREPFEFLAQKLNEL